MSLIYVTGIETAGKTTACNELKRRGFEAYDIDEGIAHYYDKTTGKQSEWLSAANQRTPEWHQCNAYMMDRAHVQRLADEAKNKLIFLCGTTQHDEVVLDLFDRVVYLYLDEPTLKQRMSNRLSTEFAFSPEEQVAVLGWHKSSEDGYRERGASMVDATLPVEKVADTILAEAQG